MARPGVVIGSRSQALPRTAPKDTGVWNVVGVTERGRVDLPLTLRSMGDYERYLGSRTPAAMTLYDSMDAFFRGGGVEARVARVAGAGAVKATRTLSDRAGAPAPTLAVDALGPGTYGNAFTVQVIDGVTANTFILVIAQSGVELERSPELANPTAAVAWGASAEHVRVRDLAAATVAPNNNPAVAAATALATGTEGAGVVDADRVAALTRLPQSLGAGQVSVPGSTTATIHNALVAHANANNRVALLDSPDTPTVGTLAALRAAVTAGGPEVAGIFAPWVQVPGVVPRTIRTVPPSAVVAALIARSDSRNSTNVPPAGGNGVASYALAVSREWTDTERETLNAAGVNVLRQVGSDVQLYGFRSLANPVTAPAWLSLAAVRLRMAIAAEAVFIGEHYLFAQLDGRGKKLAEFNGALVGMLLGHYNADALYGEQPSEAFSVDTGPGVNTPTTLAAGELRAVLAIRVSPFAELVTIEIVKVAITDVLP